MTNTPLQNILPAERYTISLFIAVTNSLLIYSLSYGKKKWMTKTEMIESTPAAKELSSQWIPVKKLLKTMKNF